MEGLVTAVISGVIQLLGLLIKEELQQYVEARRQRLEAASIDRAEPTDSKKSTKTRES